MPGPGGRSLLPGLPLVLIGAMSPASLPAALAADFAAGRLEYPGLGIGAPQICVAFPASNAPRSLRAVIAVAIDGQWRTALTGRYRRGSLLSGRAGSNRYRMVDVDERATDLVFVGRALELWAAGKRVGRYALPADSGDERPEAPCRPS